MHRCPQAGHLPRDHPRGHRAGSHHDDDTSRTSWRGGVLCSAPCKGRPPDASRPGPRTRCCCHSRPLPTATTRTVPARGRWRARAAGITAAPGRPRLLTRCCIMHHAARLREPKWTPVEETAAWAPAPRSQPAPVLPLPTLKDASSPGAGPKPLPAPPSRGPTRRRGPLQGDPEPSSCPGAGGGRALTEAAGGRRVAGCGLVRGGARHAPLGGRPLGRRRGAQGAGAGAAVRDAGWPRAPSGS